MHIQHSFSLLPDNTKQVNIAIVDGEVQEHCSSATVQPEVVF